MVRKSVLMRAVAVVLVCLTLVSANVTAVQAATVMPRYNNVVYSDSDVWIENGELNVVYNYIGNDSTTKAVITTKVERKTLLFFWADVDEWTDTVYDTMYLETVLMPLGKKGTYRVTVEYVFYGTGGAADTVTYEFEVEY